MGTTSAYKDLERINDDTNLNGTSIEAFFVNSVIFVTGATGFLDSQAQPYTVATAAGCPTAKTSTNARATQPS